LAAYCLTNVSRPTPNQVYRNETLRGEFQSTLRQLGFVFVWPQVNEQEAPDGHRYGGGG